MKNLSDLQVGECARVVCILPCSVLRRRLQDIGLVDGTFIKCLHKSPAGDPVAFYIRGAVIALRNEDAINILVR